MVPELHGARATLSRATFADSLSILNGSVSLSHSF